MQQEISPTPRLAISVIAFCLAVGIGKTHFYQEVKAGRIRILKSGRKTLVPASECAAYLERLATQDQH